MPGKVKYFKASNSNRTQTRAWTKLLKASTQEPTSRSRPKAAAGTVTTSSQHNPEPCRPKSTNKKSGTHKIIMAELSTIGKYNGKGDAKRFIHQFTSYCDFHDYSPEQRLSLIPLVLEDSALDWFETVDIQNTNITQSH